MNIKEITDRKGRVSKWDESAGHGWFVEFSRNYLKDSWKQTLEEVKALELRGDDVMICTFPKSGTHWIWEIVSMVTKQSTEYEKYSKVALTLENESSEFLATFRSPRVLNTHLYASCLPEQVTRKQTKVIHVARSPKDVAVSFYHNMKALNCMFDDPPYETFSEFLPYVTGEYGVYLIGSIFKYWKEFDQFTSTNAGNVLNLHYEQMKKDPKTAVQRVAEFLNKDLSAGLIDEITEKCSFKNLQHADKTLKQLPKEFFANFGEDVMKKFEQLGPVSVFRKDLIGFIFKYWKEFEQFTSTNTGNVLNLHYEQMKKDPRTAVQKVAEFLNKDLSAGLIDEITEKCSFKNLQHADKTLKQLPKEFFANFGEDVMKKFEQLGPVSVFRKGEVGDCKNYFTVAESEHFDMLLQEQLKDNMFWSFYTKLE